MRKVLETLIGKVVTVTAYLVRYSLVKNYGGTSVTVLLTNLIITGGKNIQIKLDHMWLKVSTIIASRNIEEGSLIKFTATVVSYWKGSGIKELDYCLRQITGIKILEKGRGQSFSEFFNGTDSIGFNMNKYERRYN
jgi:hypothetical protein